MFRYMHTFPPIKLTGPKPKEIKAETFRIKYLIRSRKVEKLGLSQQVKRTNTLHHINSNPFITCCRRTPLATLLTSPVALLRGDIRAACRYI